MDERLLVLAVTILSVAWLYLHLHTKKSSSQQHKKTSSTDRIKKYQGVTIHPYSKACHSVQSLKNKRFLADNVPSLPVAGCDASQCACTYQHHTDRRSGEDRRYPSLAMQSVLSETEKRSRKDRRQHSFA